MYLLFPKPKQYDKLLTDDFSLPSDLKVMIPDTIRFSCHNAGFQYEETLMLIFPSCTLDFLIDNGEKACESYLTVNLISCHKEGYRLLIETNGITISCSSASGFYYALKSLKQIMNQTKQEITCIEVTDEPSLALRGIMLDIGRDKIPTMKTLYDLIDKFADMRINHLELYMEGFSFDYPQYRYLFSDETPITAEELQKLITYASKHFIDLVPNQNVLGHMEKWLEKPQFSSLAECEDGFIHQNLFWRPPTTLDINDERSYQLAATTLDSLLENFSSSYINVNLDEPFELGRGKNEAKTLEHGRLKLYFDYVKKIYDYCKSKHKTMLMWGDEIMANPECVTELPEDVILLDWNYNGNVDFAINAKAMHEAGRNFCLCPGSSSWCSITGRFDNMKKNITNAIDCAIQYEALGVITTDWGDYGHWQYLSASFPSFAYTGLYAWSGIIEDDGLINWYCNRYIYQDRAQSAFQIACDLGKYSRFEGVFLSSSCTLSSSVMTSPCKFDSFEEFDEKIRQLLVRFHPKDKTQDSPVIHPDYEGLEEYLNQMEIRISNMDLTGLQSSLIKDEMLNGIEMIRHGILLFRTMTQYRNEPLEFQKNIKFLSNKLDCIMKQHYNLWMNRNRSGGFARSTGQMLHLLGFYQKTMKSFEKI